LSHIRSPMPPASRCPEPLADEARGSFSFRSKQDAVVNRSLKGDTREIQNAALQEIDMDTTTLLLIVVVILLLGGGGWYGRGRWY
jgi:hypothetical protein